MAAGFSLISFGLAMMAQIKEESVGFLFNLEVEVRQTDGGDIEAKGLATPTIDAQKLQYTAPNDAGEVEVRNDRGQVQKAATSKARQREAEQEAPADAPRGAFGQPVDGGEDAAAGNRAQRRAAGKKR